MTILEHIPFVTISQEQQSITADFTPQTEERRRYHHPHRERFVEEAAMSREMFRL